MSNGKSQETHKKKLTFTITPKGSLGLLAYGDIGLREWRKVKRNTPKKES